MSFSFLNHLLGPESCSWARRRCSVIISFRTVLMVFSFYNGGLLFSLVVFVIISAISLYSFLLLAKVKSVVPGSFGGM